MFRAPVSENTAAFAGIAGGSRLSGKQWCARVHELEMNVTPSRSSPWYREPLVWMVLAIPAAAVVAGAVMLVLANATWDGLVADDYYQRGMQINRSLARDAAAGRLELEASLSFPAPGVVEARLTGMDIAAATSDGGRLNLRFARAARAGKDVRIPMTRDVAGMWRGTLPAIAPGKWYVELGNDQWRLAAPVRMPASRRGFVLYAPDASASSQPQSFWW